MDSTKKQPRSILVVWLTLILFATGVPSAIFTVLLIYYRTTDALETADSRLLTAAEMSREILGQNYHDLVKDPTSISAQQFDRIVNRNDRLCRRFRLQYLWSVLKVNDDLVFTSATHSDINDSTSSCASFFEKHKDPAAFSNAIKPEDTLPVFSSFRNEWGEGRMVLVPRTDSHGRRYIFGASLQLTEYNTIARHALMTALGIGLLVMVLAFLFSVVITRRLVLPISQLTKAADQMASGDLEISFPDSDIREIHSLTRSFGRMRDELKHTIEALRGSEEHLKKIFETMAEGCVYITADGEIAYANTEAERILGLHRDTIRGKSYVSPDWKIIRIDGTPMPPEEMAGSRAMKEQRLIRNVVMGIQRDDASVCWVTVCAAPLFNMNHTLEGVIGTFTDITEQQRVQDELQNKQKLESLGILAGGIAHDFNNLMSGIYGNIEMALEESRKRGVKEYLSCAISTIDRARNLTRQLLTFAKGGTPTIRLESLTPFVQKTAQFALSGSPVSCTFLLPDTLWKCKYDKNQIAQVISNLVVNAQQAMSESGNIMIAGQNVVITEDTNPQLKPGRYVKVSVGDSGTGIPEEILSRIFDPFFTTKSNGHGLGLSTCYSIVKRHGGTITVESETGKGSTFHVFLPASTDTASETVGEENKTSYSGTGTILLMDDERITLEVERSILESFGHSVVCVENGNEAIDSFNKADGEKHEFVALILDLTIPGGLGGKEVIKEIRKVDKDIPVIVASGYADDPVIANPAQYGFTASISKPFRKRELAEILKKCLKSEKVQIT